MEMNIRKSMLLFWVSIPLLMVAQEKAKGYELWYGQPASKWMEALPVGNGRLGAMVFGDPNHERIQLNEDSMWSGAADWGDAVGSPQDLAEIRELLRGGKNHLVDSLIVARFSHKTILRSHQTMGDLYIDFGEDKKFESYRRSLHLDDAVAYMGYASGSNVFSQKVFASHPDDVLVIELETTDSKGMDFTLRMDRPEDTGKKTVTVANPSPTEISMKGTVTQYGGKKDSKPYPIDYGVEVETRL